MLETARFLSRYDKMLPGIKSQVLVPQPAAGAEWSIAVPGGQEWRVLTAIATLTTGVAVAQRAPGAQIMIGGAPAWQMNSGTSLAASSAASVVYTLGSLSGETAAASFIFQVGLPTLWLPPGFTIGSWTVNLQGADQYSAIRLYVEQVYATDEEWSGIAEERREYMLAEAAARGGQ